MSHRAFWEAGFRVFGLHPILPNGRCGCGRPDCEAAGKHPLISNWTHTPLWSEEQIEVMEETGQFDSGYGVLVRGMIVIDVDARNGGVESYASLIEDVPAIAGAGLIVETGSGGGSRHLYFKCDEGLALVQNHPDYPGIDFKSSGFVVGPGSKHISGNTYKILSGSPEDIDVAPDALIRGLTKAKRHRAEIDGVTVDVSYDDLADMLSHIDPDSGHEVWIRCGMAVHHATMGSGFDVWDNWSAKGTKYPGKDVLYKRWHSFGKSVNPVTLGTLVHYAEQGGWVQSVTFEPNEIVEADEPFDGNEIDTTGIDLTRPPGFVGTVAEWIHDQCRYVREHLAVAAAINAIGNVVGLRYLDELGDVTSNTFAFCVAASGTGKEGIQQGEFAVHKAAGINKAVYSTIKSEQEVVRNLTRHQAAFYVIDEVGILLQKIKNAQTRGGASYLEGVIGILMSAYSKANGSMPLGGDVREEVRKLMLQELAQIERRLDEAETPRDKARKAHLETALVALDDGLDRPFLSVIGYTTPVTFEGLVTYEAAANGFIGRSLIFQEHKDVPEYKKNFRKRKMPKELAMTLRNLYSAGYYDINNDKIEHRDDRVSIPTTKDAEDVLNAAMDILHGMAEDHTEKSGLSSLFLRSKELVAKISFILAVPSGLRTVEHVRWAYALVKRDVEQKVRLVIGNDRVKDAPKEALFNSISSVISQDDGETLGVLTNKLRKFKKEDIEKCLNDMVRVGKAVLEETIHPRKKIKVKRYKLK
jgi:Bifunctional DNA primase/polymerase, N-terminal/Primase C terminal 2 (PriCT-2)/Protein of unknown function (DUF3987)